MSDHHDQGLHRRRDGALRLVPLVPHDHSGLASRDPWARGRDNAPSTYGLSLAQRRKEARRLHDEEGWTIPEIRAVVDLDTGAAAA